MKNRSLWHKLKFAWQGIIYAIKHEHNMQRHMIISMAVLVFFSWLDISLVWWALIIVSMGLVIAAEMANSAIEALVDYLHPELHEQIGHAKDMLAGMVLILSITAVIIGLLAIVVSLSTP